MPREAPEEPEVRAMYISEKDVEKHGATEGCPGCRALMNPFSRYRAKHTPECRARMEEAMMQSEEGAARVTRAADRHALSKASTEGKADAEEAARAKRAREGQASSSGQPESKKQEELTKLKEAEDAEMKVSPTPAEEEPALEEAPEARGDIRVPMAARAPAVKRVMNSEAEGATGGKWQTVEVENRKRDRPDDIPQAAKQPHPTDAGIPAVDTPVDNLHSHPGPVTKRHEVQRGDLVWKDIGSGTMARTFLGATQLGISTKGGPPECEVHRRTVWDLSTGRIIDDCVLEDTPDSETHRQLAYETDIRVELVLKDALAMYAREGADVVEIFSQPRIAQEAAMRPYGGTRLQPGWSLDLTRTDPKTGRAWDLSDKQVQSRVKK